MDVDIVFTLQLLTDTQEDKNATDTTTIEKLSNIRKFWITKVCKRRPYKHINMSMNTEIVKKISLKLCMVITIDDTAKTMLHEIPSSNTNIEHSSRNVYPFFLFTIALIWFIGYSIYS